MENNIFEYATRELSQDAFLAWLINWIKVPVNASNKGIKKLSKEFIINIIKDKTEWVNLLNNDEDSIEVTVEMQYYNIDVLVLMHNKKTDKYLIIIIEDKVQSLEHDSQIDRYKNTIQKKIFNDESKIKEDDILTCYYKPYDECGINPKKVNCIYVRKKHTNDNNNVYGIYELLQKYEKDIQQEYFKDYLEYIKAIEEYASNNVANRIINKRKYDIKFLAFFKTIETEFLKNKKNSDEEIETEYIGIGKKKNKKVKILEDKGEKIYFDKGTTRSEPTWWCNIPINLKVESDLFYKYAFIKINFYEEKKYTIMLKIAKKQEPIIKLEDYNTLPSDKNFTQEKGEKIGFEVKKNTPIFSYYDKEDECIYKVYNKYNGKIFKNSKLYEEVTKLFEDKKIHLYNGKDFIIDTSGKGNTKTQPEMDIFTIKVLNEEEKSFEDIKEIIKKIREKLENNKIIIKSIDNSNELFVKIIKE